MLGGLVGVGRAGLVGDGWADGRSVGGPGWSSAGAKLQA